MTDSDVIAAIQRTHLKMNISENDDVVIYWDEAVVDPGGSIFGPGPYLHVPVVEFDGGETIQRVYAPARLRRRLAARWARRR